MTVPPAGWPILTGDDEPSRQVQPAADEAAGARDRRSSRRSGDGPAQGQAVSVLADRLAAALVHHEPGWRLPRHSALARRYNVSPAEIDAAVEELVGRHMVRRLADGQLYRASPAEYVIGIEGIPGLTTYVDTMGGEFSCRGRQLTWRLPPEDIAWALGQPSDQQVCLVRLLWTGGGEPAALCTTYIPGDLASRINLGTTAPLPANLNLLQVAAVAGIPQQSVAEPIDGVPPSPGSPSAQLLAGSPAALHIELQAPPPSVARSLRLTAGQPALMITVRFAEPGTDRPVALTIAVLRPDMFRVIVQTPQPPLSVGAGSSADSWAHAAEGWES